MGKCPGDSQPYQFSLNDLADVYVGDSKQMNKGCGPHVDGTQDGSGYAWMKNRGFGWPENGEFEWGGLGESCGLCSDIAGGYGCECSGGNAVIGKRGKVKRIAFKADPTECCLQNSAAKNSTKILNGLTCEPKYRDPSNSECNAVFLDYCSDDKIVSDQKCINLKNSNSTLYNRLMTNYCNASSSNASTSDCIDWCKSNMSSCTLLDTDSDCKVYNIPSNKCTPQAVNTVKNKCQTYGMLSSQGLPVGSYPCTGEGITSFEQACKVYNLIPGTTCTANALDNAKLESQSERLANDATEQSQQQFEETQKILSKVLNMPIASPPTDKSNSPTDTSNSSNMTIFVILLLLAISLFVSSILGILVVSNQ